MTSDHINIKLTHQPYQKRVRSIFSWTFLLYLTIAVVAGLSTNIDGFMLTILFLALLFILDYYRRLRWVKFIMDTLETNSAGIKLSYYDKDSLISTTISWDNLKVSKGTTFTRNPIKLISIKNGQDNVASFYGNTNIDNNKIDELYRKLTELKTASA